MHAPTIDSGSPYGSSEIVRSEHDGEHAALLIAWAPAEPHRLGEVALLDPEAGAQILGRGEISSGRLRFHRQRPGAIEPGEPLSSPGISRDQLRVRSTGDRLQIERIGKCAMEIRGEPADRVEVAPGDTVLLKGQLLLYCTRRPRRMAPLVSASLADAPRFGEPDVHGLVGESPTAWRLRDELAWIGRAGQHTLILGDSGAGKELCARAIHARSARADGAVVARNAATIPRDLIDAELFGNVRGYPNPGMPERPGMIGAADGGTLFLDELGELPHGLQANLLRVLDDAGEYHRLGAATASRSRFRLIGATNREVTALKHDLAARLVLRLRVPGIDERRDDIPLLARHLLRRAAAHSPEATARFVLDRATGDLRVTARLVAHLFAVRYPLNVREMDALLWQAMAGSGGDAITWRLEERASSASAPLPTPDSLAAPTLPRAAEPEPSEAEVRSQLAEHRGNVVRTARALGLTSRYVLYRLMRKHGIEA